MSKQSDWSVRVTHSCVTNVFWLMIVLRTRTHEDGDDAEEDEDASRRRRRRR